LLSERCFGADGSIIAPYAGEMTGWVPVLHGILSFPISQTNDTATTIRDGDGLYVYIAKGNSNVD
jgi:hypothetical protein